MTNPHDPPPQEHAPPAQGSQGPPPHTPLDYRNTGPHVYAVNTRSMFGVVELLIGGLFLMLGWRMINIFLLGNSKGHTFVDETGAPLEYTASIFVWQDAGPVVAGLVLLVGGLTALIGVGKPIMIGVMVAAGAGLLFNAGYTILTFNSYGLSLIHGVVAIVLAFVVYSRLELIKALSDAKRYTAADPILNPPQQQRSQ